MSRQPRSSALRSPSLRWMMGPRGRPSTWDAMVRGKTSAASGWPVVVVVVVGVVGVFVSCCVCVSVCVCVGVSVRI